MSIMTQCLGIAVKEIRKELSKEYSVKVTKDNILIGVRYNKDVDLIKVETDLIKSGAIHMNDVIGNYMFTVSAVA